ncbi:DUF5703 family protein [Demequina zhanjiangensis]|uniref:DUF5703 family protein n=1 Tax=Demequina zhanjiangensis TaxID=3051659 RepID=A0ABT8G1V4_9MICO|nr:DUF5703 family protein [Demequina sp. SYSU T00b26]MDN4473117.1 DUF5703 family protein [Demequina sp. SYSU T00b26]
MNSTPDSPRHVVTPKRAKDAQRSRFEWRVVTIPRDVSKADARAMLTEQAEYGHWELARTQLFIGGTRKFWLRRRTMRVERFDAA